MLREELSSVLILESDVAWDINIRAIMSNFHHHFTLLLLQLNSTQLPRIKRVPQTESESVSQAFPDPEDPWHSKHWDVLYLGHCSETPLNHEHMLKYQDEHVSAGKSYYGRTLGNERVVRKSGGIACTTGYAITQSGAAKLLLRTATDLDLPVDLVMASMIMEGSLVAYSVQPTIMTQWKYVTGIGMNLRGSNSDVPKGGDDVADEDPQAWELVSRTGNVWMPVEYFVESGVNETTMQQAWKRIFGEDGLPLSLETQSN